MPLRCLKKFSDWQMSAGMPHNPYVSPDTASPYPYLYIYYLAGHLPGGEIADFGPGFIGNWKEGGTAFLFFTEPADDAVHKFLAARPHLELKDRFEMSYEDWHGGPVAPFQAGGFYVVPPWAQAPEGADKDFNSLFLDPGVVFGAGNHPTTRHCLMAIESLMAHEKESVGRVLDLGAGTGLLALAAAKLGASSVLAVDNNFLAARTTLTNIRHNHLSDRVFSVAGSAQDFIDCPADLVVANIHYDVMQQLVAAPGFRQKKWFVLSGLMRTQARRIKDRLAHCRAEMLDEWLQDGIWHTMLGKLM